MVASGCPRKQVVRQAERYQVFHDGPVVAVGKDLGLNAFLVGGHEDRGAVLIGSRHHEHVVPRHAHVARKDIGGHTETGNVADATGWLA